MIATGAFSTIIVIVHGAKTQFERHKRSNFSRSLARVATSACNENPAILSTVSGAGLSDSQSGKVCKVNTLRPCCGPTAMRYVSSGRVDLGSPMCASGEVPALIVVTRSLNPGPARGLAACDTSSLAGCLDGHGTGAESVIHTAAHCSVRQCTEYSAARGYLSKSYTFCPQSEWVSDYQRNDHAAQRQEPRR